MSTPREPASLPLVGRPAEDLFREISDRRRSDIDWRAARTFSLVYPTGRDDVDEVLARAAHDVVFENALNPLRFPSLGLMEREVIEMTGLTAPAGFRPPPANSCLSRCATPSSMAVWPSWPQACMLPFTCEQ